MGWQKFPKAFCAYSCSIFIILTGLFIASCVIGDFYGSTVLFKGKCSKVHGINLGTHIAITVFAAFVTVSSDRFLSLVLAPQPEDIRRAHANFQWVEIGVNSWRNLGFANTWRRVCWVLLLLSSVPLQLLFNAAVFHTETSTDYQQIMVSQNFLDGGPWQVPGIATVSFGEGWIQFNQSYYDLVEEFQRYSQGSNWTKLDAVECQKTYLDAPNGLQVYRNLIIVIEAGPDPNAKGWTGAEVWNNSMPMYYSNLSTYAYDPDAVNTLWAIDYECYISDNGNICSGGLGQYDGIFDESFSNFSESWEWGYVEATFGSFADAGNFSQAYDNITGVFCLAEPFISPCKMEVTNGFLLAVCICLFVKSCVSIFILVKTKNKQPILCLGDMIQLQLESENDDCNTKGLCTYDQNWFRNAKPVRDAEATDDMRPRWIGQPRKWANKPKRWKNAVPRGVWWATYAFIGVVLLLVFIILGIAFQSYSGAAGGLHDRGFGDNPNNFQLHLFNSRVSGAIVANLPQSILTSCYFWFTALYVRMFQARDWARFSETGSSHRLMVTEPQDDQESFYMLGIPLPWGLLFLACSIVLHWTTGQSLYQIASEDIPTGPDDYLASPLQFDIAFSVEAIWVTLVLAVLTVVIPVALSFRVLPESSIIVGTNSAAISAQCHRARRQPDIQDELVSEAESGPEVDGAAEIPQAEDGIELTEINLSLVRRPSGDSTDSTSFRTTRTTPESEESGQPGRASRVIESSSDNFAVEDREEHPSILAENQQTLIPDDEQGGTPEGDAESETSAEIWLQPLRWGVLVEGSTNRNNPGQLGLASLNDIIGTPINGHFYE